MAAVRLELGNIHRRMPCPALDAIASAATVLELSIDNTNTADIVAAKANLYPGQHLKGVSAVTKARLHQCYGVHRRMSKDELWAAIASTIDSMLNAATLAEWVVLNEIFAVARWMARTMGGMRSLLIHSYSHAQAVAPNSRLALRDLFAAPWPEILAALADPACKRVIQSVEVQVRCDLGWPPKLPVNTSQATARLGWHLKRSRFFRAMRVSQLRELVQAIQDLGYEAALTECTAWVGPTPTPASYRAQGKLYGSWLNLAQETGCRISWWDWHDGMLRNPQTRYEAPDFPGLWAADGVAKHPRTVSQWNLN